MRPPYPAPAPAGPRRLLPAALAALTVGAAAVAAQAPPPPSQSHLERAAEYNAKADGVSLLVMHDGQIVFEDYPTRYHPEAGPATAWYIASGTKSFWGPVAARMIGDGLIASFDELVADTVTEWRGDPRKGRITLRQLLSLTSGLEASAIGVPSYAEAIQAPAVAEPGTVFDYGPVPYQVFGEVIRRKLRAAGLGSDPVTDYLRPRILDPVGSVPEGWRTTREGDPHLPSGAMLTARAWAPYGELIRLGGTWEGEEIVPRVLLDECFVGSTVRRTYGLTWWLEPAASPVAGDLVSALGAGGQSLFVSRRLALVVVRQTSTTGRGDAESLARRDLFDQRVFWSLLRTGEVGRPDRDGDLVPDDRDAFPDRADAYMDVDGDGLGDAFEHRIIDHDPADALRALADVRPDDDYDGDGASNRAEFEAGTDPTDPASRPGMPPAPGPRFALVHTDDTPAMKSTALVDPGDGGPPHLAMARSGGYVVLRNDGAGRFERVLERASRNSTGWGAHDLDADGLVDLFLTQNDAPDGLFHAGDGALTVRDVGLEGEGVVRTVLFADYDGDGLTDAYLSTSAFGLRHDWNQLRRGLPGGGFGPNVIDAALHPPVPGFWHAPADGPNGCVGEWSTKQFKGAVVRDLDGDGRPDIVAAAYADRGYQDDRCTGWAQAWVEAQDRGLFVLHNRSTPGAIRFAEVGLEAVGPDAHGDTTADWNPYHAVPLDYDRDGDLDLFVGAVLRPAGGGAREDTRAVQLLENVSTPGRVRFNDATDAAGLGWLNDLPVAARGARSLAAGAPVDLDNDGWVDLALINRRDLDETPHPHVHVFRNERGRFEEVPSAAHGLTGGGGRDIAHGDLDGDGRQDLVINDGTAGGYEGANNSRVYLNRTAPSGHWLVVRAVAGPNGAPAIGAKVRVSAAGGELLGYEETRTDFSYRSKRLPALHFGLGDATRANVCVQARGRPERCWRGLAVDTTVVLDLDAPVEGRRIHLPYAGRAGELTPGP